MRMIMMLAGLLLTGPAGAQHSVRMQDEPVRIESPEERTINRIDRQILKGPLPGTASDEDIRRTAIVGCEPGFEENCIRMWTHARDKLAAVWANEGLQSHRAAAAIAIRRATKKGVTDWSEAESKYAVWIIDQDNALAEFRGRSANPRIESNCAVETWKEGTRTRSRAYCW